MKYQRAMLLVAAPLWAASVLADNSALSSLPPAVRSAIQNRIGDGALRQITPDTEDGSITYDAQIIRNGQSRELTFDDEGHLLSEQVGMADVPQPARKTIHARVGKGRVLSVVKNLDGDEVTYEVEMHKGARRRSFTVDADGTLLDMEVFPSELPSAVRDMIAAKTSGGTLDTVTKVIDGDDISYEADYTRSGRSRTLTVGQDGEMLGFQVFMDELPVAARKAFAQQSAGGRIGEIDRSTEEGETSYTAEVTTDHQTHSVTVWNDGDVEIEVPLSEATKEVQEALATELKTGAHLDSFEKTVQDGDSGYEAEVSNGDVTRTLDYDPDGTLSYQEQPISLANAPEPVQKTLRTTPGKLATLTQCNEDGDITYEAEITDNGKSANVVLDPSGATVPSQ